MPELQTSEFTLERRAARLGAVEMRAAEDGTPAYQFDAIVLRYDVLDDYGTRFAPKAFTESLAERQVRVMLGHRWGDVTQLVGRVVSWDDNDERLQVTVQLQVGLDADGMDKNPAARQAFHLLDDELVDQFSIGFIRRAEEHPEGEPEWVARITKGDLYEVSLVFEGSVPGTELVGVRSATGNTLPPATEAATSAVPLTVAHQGEQATVEDLRAALAGNEALAHLADSLPSAEVSEADEASGADEGASGAQDETSADDPDAEARGAQLDAEVDETLSMLEGRLGRRFA